MFVQTHFQRAHRNQSHGQHNQLSHSSHSHSINQPQRHCHKQQQHSRRSVAREQSTCSAANKSSSWLVSRSPDRSTPSAVQPAQRQIIVVEASEKSADWSQSLSLCPPRVGRRLGQERTSSQQFGRRERQESANADDASESHWSSRLAQLVRRLAERASKNANLSVTSKRNLELFASFCVGFVSYQLETWRLLAVDAALAPEECLSGGQPGRAGQPGEQPAGRSDRQHPSEVARRARLVHSQSEAKCQPDSSKRAPLRHQFSLDGSSTLAEVESVMHSAQPPQSPLSFALDLEQQHRHLHVHGPVVYTFEPPPARARQPIPQQRAFAVFAQTGPRDLVSPVSSARPSGYLTDEAGRQADEPERSQSALSERSSEQVKCKSPNPSKKSTSSKLSFAGAKRRLGFKQKGLSSISVQRSEEIFPREFNAHLVRQPTTNSLSDSGNETSGSLWCERLHPRMSPVDPRANFIDGLGAGQIASRQALVSPYMGDIQLSLFDRRGALELEVVRARYLQPKACAKRMPSPYVKVYLMRQKKCVAKAKTEPIQHTLDPLYQKQFVFHQDYADCVLQVIVWTEYSKRDRKSLIGVVQIQLSQLDLANLQIGWYRLFNTVSMASALTQTPSSASSCSSARDIGHTRSWVFG